MAKFPVITQHLNLEEGSEARTADGSTFDINIWDPKSVDPFPYSLGLGAFPRGAGVTLSVAANSKFAKRDMVEKIVEKLCTILGHIS